GPAGRERADMQLVDQRIRQCPPRPGVIRPAELVLAVDPARTVHTGRLPPRAWIRQRSLIVVEQVGIVGAVRRFDTGAPPAIAHRREIVCSLTDTYPDT